MTSQTTLKIQGMHCDSCKEVIEDVCLELLGVQKCKVSVEEGIAAIEHNVPIDHQELINEIESLGVYKVLDVQTENREDAS